MDFSSDQVFATLTRLVSEGHSFELSIGDGSSDLELLGISPNGERRGFRKTGLETEKQVGKFIKDSLIAYRLVITGGLHQFEIEERQQ